MQIESIEHFGNICSNRIADDSSVILLLNKIDLFEQKLRHKKIRDVSAFSEYRGADLSSSDAVNFFLQKFISQIKSDRAKNVHHFVTNLLNTEEASLITTKIKMIIESKIKESECRREEVVRTTRKPDIKETGSAHLFSNSVCLKQLPLRNNQLIKPLCKSRNKTTFSNNQHEKTYTTEFLSFSSTTHKSQSQDQRTQSVSIFSQCDSHL